MSELCVTDCRTSHQHTLVGERGFTFHEWLPGEHALIYGVMPQGNGCEGLCSVRPDTLDRRILLSPDAQRRFGGVSRDGRYIAYAEADARTGCFTTCALDLRTSETSVLYRGRPALVPEHWRPDGSALVMSEPDGELGSKLFLLETRRGDLSPLCESPEPTLYRSCGWTRDGRHLYVITDEGEEYAGVAVVSVHSLERHYVATGRFDIERAAVSRCGRYLALLENRSGYSHLIVRDLIAGRDVTAPALPRGVLALTWAPRAPVLAIHINGPTNPGSIYVWAVAAGSCHLAVAADVADHRTAALPDPEHVFFTSGDGVALHGLLHMPAGSEEPRRPVVLVLHGGPTAQARPTFNPLYLDLLSSGIAVFELNYRGSSGYGRAFAALNDQLDRDKELLDVDAAVRWLERTGRFDPHQVFVLGFSYGGYLAMAVMTRRPRLMRGGIGIAGVYDWIRALEAASPEMQLSDRVEYGDIREPRHRAFLAGLSPLTHVAHLERPVLIVHGAHDPVVSVAQSDAFVDALQRAGAAVHYMRLRDEGHQLAPGQPSTLDVHAAIVRFIRALAGESGNVPRRLADSPFEFDDDGKMIGTVISDHTS